ncbi:Rieske 2Fe-2S domain-containing protein [Simkania negevensis]|uniref:Rieske 2Fe-2S domain-containing protein n=1 Tax=Simkania negevensis TaxID=83561 RepID=A0ABS3ASW4_9BACT|nr:Rieske 2Fe-2S domain-containing protein [Simkania negevensis]
MPRYRNSLKWDDDDDKKTGKASLTRRTFLAIIGFGALAGVVHMTMSTVLGFLYPNALKTPPSVFSLGRPEDLLKMEGTKMFISKQKVFIEVAGGKVRVQTAVCTHLGCTVNMVDTGYLCPCHGSTYDKEGLNTGGPAPKPLVYFSVYPGASGDLLVDKNKKVEIPAKAWKGLKV